METEETCWSVLPRVVAVVHACDHVVEYHTLMPLREDGQKVLVGIPCLWCKGVPAGVDHLHAIYDHGEAVILRTGLTLPEYADRLLWDAEMEVHLSGIHEDPDGAGGEETAPGSPA